MANTVSLLGYTNTFGDWMVATNALAKENNDLAANNYTKPTGTLYLNNPTLGLQVAANAIIQGALQVQGTGSSVFIQNTLTVGNTLSVGNIVSTKITTTNLICSNIIFGGVPLNTNNPTYSNATITTLSSTSATINNLTTSNVVISSTTNGTLLVGGGATGSIRSLANTSSAGTYGSNSAIPVITVDSYGRVTTVTTSPITIPASTSNTPVFTLTTSTSGFREGIVSVGTVTTNTNLNLSSGSVFDITLGANNIYFTFINPPASGNTNYITIVMRQDATGNRTYGGITNSKWTDGVKPILSTQSNKIDVLTLMTVDAGLTYMGSFAMANVS